jgi:GalNAc-alpha-(1->4)-GalNAc-alpha-(1->3)-diNAcBac-PP-undecaprenol alpha-1,4-N-acetyl-D-galactosaminyltransferase
MTRKHRILFLIPNLIPGGMERVMSEIIAYCSSYKNDELHIILYGKPCEIFYSLPDKVIIHQHNMKYVNSRRFIYSLKILIYLRKEVKKINPDTILSFGTIWNIFVLLSLLGLKYPIYISNRSQPNKTYAWKHELLSKWLYPKSTGMIAQTAMAKEIYMKKYKLKSCTAIANPIKDIIINDNQQRENIVITVGRLISTKHHDRLIKIFALTANLNWKLIIIGGDAQRQNNSKKLKQLIDSLNMADKIVLMNIQKNINDYLLKSKIFVFASSSEGFPNVIGEAMAAGLPVIAYDCLTGPSEMINDGKDGYLVPLFDDNVFIEKLNYLMTHDTKREEMGISAKKAIKKFNSEIICEEYYQFISSLYNKQLNQ